MTPETMDSKYLKLDDPTIVVLHTPQEDPITSNCVTCVHCTHGTSETFSEHLIDGINEREVMLPNHTRMHAAYKINDCRFSRALIKCKHDGEHEYRTPGSTCEHAAIRPGAVIEDKKITPADKAWTKNTIMARKLSIPTGGETDGE